MMNSKAMDLLVAEIRSIMVTVRTSFSREVNTTMLSTYWQIGRIIVEHDQNGELKAQYGAKLLTELSKRLSKELGRGYSRSNLYNMRELYLQYPKIQMASGLLSWSHYLELLSVKDTDARAFYEHECENAKWSVEELKRQISTSLFERLLLSQGKANKEKVLTLASEGISLSRPEDMLREPYVFEFLGVPENKPIMEKDLEAKLIRHIEQFLLELGRGFMFVGSQQRVTIGNTHYYVDMVFYNKIIKAYVLIDLKIGDLRIEHAGQMNAYLNYYKTEVNDVEDNPPIGIILCKTSKDVVAEYALGGLSNQVYASSYVYYIPDKDILISEVKALLAKESIESEYRYVGM